MTRSNSRGLPLSIFILSVVVTGCASVTHEPVTYRPYPLGHKLAASEGNVTNGPDDSALTGIRYYRSSPYLLVYTDGKGNLVWKIYNLPDQTKLMVATPHQFLSKITTNMTFVNGVLTTAHTETDSTAAVKAVIGSVEKILPLLAAADLPTDTTIPAPRLYKIVVNGNELQLLGGHGDQPITVTLGTGH